MERLTKKELANSIKTDTYIEYNKAQYKEMIKPTYEELYLKVNAIEEIQEELGIPLEVLFKALRYGRWDWQKVEKHYVFDNNITLHYNGVCWIIGHHKTDMYGKTWALTREELEDAKD